MDSYTKEMGAGNGSFAGNTVGTRNGKFAGIYIPNTCTIGTLLNSAGVNVTAKYIWDKTAAIEGGTYIHADPIDKYFSQVINSVGAFNSNFAPDQQ